MSGPAPELVGIVEIAAMMGKSRRWVYMLSRMEGFPRPAARRGKLRLWWRSEIETYLAELEKTPPGEQ